MKVLFCNRDPSGVDGGDTNKIHHYMRNLKECGVETAYAYNVWGNIDFSKWDIIHGFHLGHDWSYKFFLEAKRLGLPYVISPVYFPKQGNPTKYRREMVREASAVLYLSEGEKAAVNLLFDNKREIEDNAHIVPNGINPVFAKEAEPFRHFFRPDEEYVVCVGRIDSRKNQHSLAQACMENDIPLLLIGDPADRHVVKQCQAIADKWDGLWWEPAKPPEMIARAVRSAKVLACPSTLEMWPNVVAEGGLAGCNLVVSSNSMSFTDLDGVFTCEPSINSISEAVLKAYSSPRDGKLVDYFRQFTWEKTSGQLLEIYNSVVKN